MDYVVSMAYHNQVPWHGKGYHSDCLMTPEEIREKCGMNFEIRKKEARTEKGEIVPGVYYLERANHDGTIQIFDSVSVGDQFVPYQPTDFVDFFNDITRNVLFANRGEDGGVQMMETGGVLKFPGRVMWMLAKLPGEIVMPGKRDDAIHKYFLITTANDGTSTTQVRFCAMRVVCWNTLTAALRENEVSISAKHTINAQARLLAAKKALGIMEKSYEETAMVWQAMERRQIVSSELMKYLEKVFPGKEEGDEISTSTRTQNIRERIVELHDRDPYARGNLWGAFGAVVEYLDHEKSRRGTTERGYDVLFGSAVNTQRRAFEIAKNLVA